MKKLFMACLVILTATALFAEEGPNRRGSADGTGTWKGPDSKFFITVKNTSGGALVAGDVVILDVAEDDGYSVTTTTSAGQTGHCALAEACADDAFCKCQTYGLATVAYDATGDDAVAGGPVFIGENNAGDVEAITAPSASDNPIAVFMDAATVSGSATVFLKMR